MKQYLGSQSHDSDPSQIPYSALSDHEPVVVAAQPEHKIEVNSAVAMPSAPALVDVPPPPYFDQDIQAAPKINRIIRVNQFVVRKNLFETYGFPLAIICGAIQYTAWNAANNGDDLSNLLYYSAQASSIVLAILASTYFIVKTGRPIGRLIKAKYNFQRAIVEHGYMSQESQNLIDKSCGAWLSTILDFATTGTIIGVALSAVTSNFNWALSLTLATTVLIGVRFYFIDSQLDLERHRMILNGKKYESGQSRVQTLLTRTGWVLFIVALSLGAYAIKTKLEGFMHPETIIAGIAAATGIYLIPLATKFYGTEAFEKAINMKSVSGNVNINAVEKGDACCQIFKRRDLKNELLKLSVQLMIAGGSVLLYDAKSFSILPAAGALFIGVVAISLLADTVADDLNRAVRRMDQTEVKSDMQLVAEDRVRSGIMGRLVNRGYNLWSGVQKDLSSRQDLKDTPSMIGSMFV